MVVRAVRAWAFGVRAFGVCGLGLGVWVVVHRIVGGACKAAEGLILHSGLMRVDL